ncbi:MAG: hypothetical protein NE327_21095 [Lentisphaeraceae bacterium]|nr:hypothetical protein [Lentisphaeraceae bacterium]
MRNSQEIKKTDAATSIHNKTTRMGTFDKGNISMILHKFKQTLCRHRHTRGVTLVIATNTKIVRCIHCEKLIQMESILGGHE